MDMLAAIHICLAYIPFYAEYADAESISHNVVCFAPGTCLFDVSTIHVIFSSTSNVSCVNTSMNFNNFHYSASYRSVFRPHNKHMSVYI